MGEIQRPEVRVAMFSDSYTPIVNGVSVSIEALVDELRARGHSVHIFTSGFPRHKDSDPNIYRCHSVYTPWAKGYPLAIPPFYKMLRHFRKNEFDIIHTHTPFTMGFVGLRWAESHYLPLVTTYHTLYEKYAHYIPFFPKRYLRYKCARHTNYYYNRCDHVIAPSEAAQKSLHRHRITSPISVIPTGNPEAKKLDRASARKVCGVRETEKLLLYVGRIAREKNMPMLLEMAKSVIREQEDTKLLLVGDGPMIGECKNMVREFGIGDNVRFVGAVPRADVDAYYQASDLFVFSSMTETQGLVIGEAMTHGVPAVAVHGGGASTAIIDNENGFVVSNNVGQFSDTVLRVLRNPALHGRISEGAKRSAKRWTLSDMGESVIDVYEQVIRSRATHAVVEAQVSHANPRAH